MSSSTYTAITAASNLTRPRVAVAVFSAVTAAVASYYYYHYYSGHSHSTRPESLPPGPGLRRRNAVRRARHGSEHEDSEESEPHGDENVDIGLRESIEAADNQGHTDIVNNDWYEAGHDSRQRTGENIVTLLFRVSEDNARRNAYVHRGCLCNGCGMVPIRGIRYRCANCNDFDLCEVCESQGLHNKTHIFYKVRVPAPPFGPRLVQSPWYLGDPDNAIRNLPRYLLSKWSHETGFERVELDAFWEQWTFMANTEWRDDPDNLGLAMDKKTFERCLVPSGGYRHSSPNLIHDRMFAFYDTNHDDLIGFEEFLHGVSYRKRKDKLRRTFDGYDIDGDGYVSRRDFLRMFRAYYVLYKQMHRDTLQGLDDHMMTTAEAQQLVNSRQPLSSLFGREGGVPQADHHRPMEGKIFHSDGEVRLADDKGAIDEDKPDTANREDILTGLFTRNPTQNLFTDSFRSSSSRTPRSPNGEARYWGGIINPPQNMVDISTLISGDYTQLGDILDSIRIQEPDTPVDDDETESSEEEQGEEENRQPAPDGRRLDGVVDEGPADPSGPTASQLIPDAVGFTNSLPTESRLRAQHQAIATSMPRYDSGKRRRVHARRQLHERWKRRQFYLDEEEGANAPQGWQDNQDVLANLDHVAESSKSAQPALSPRSRSSSKVRFAEDTDDFDIRSNPSTSSRSVPERWGGMEIPDAERDAGKEILYQITQQAFNELLDELFKNKEDLAIRAAETKEDRAKYRHLLENINLEDEDEKSTGKFPSRSRSPPLEGRHAGRIVAQMSPAEHLTSSGYTFESEEGEDRSTEVGPVPEPMGDQIKDAAATTVEDPTQGDVLELDATRPRPGEYRDPTMPQFRPNTTLENSIDSTLTSVQRGDNNGIQPDQVISPDTRATSGTREPHRRQARESKLADPESVDHIPHSTLVTWKRLNLAEQEARGRGGWGRLNYAEFEAIYREHEFQDSGRNRLDYLSSWIDFCIP